MSLSRVSVEILESNRVMNMKRIRACFAAVLVMVAFASGAHAQIAASDNLAHLKATGGSVGIGDKIFSEFDYTPNGLTTFDPSTLQVTASVANGVYYLTFGGSIGLASGVPAVANLQLKYKVTATAGLIDMIDQAYTGSVQPAGAASLMVDENVYSGVTPVAVSHLGVGDLSDPIAEVGDDLDTSPGYSTLDVVADIQLSIDTGAGFVTISQIIQSFHQMPCDCVFTVTCPADTTVQCDGDTSPTATGTPMVTSSGTCNPVVTHSDSIIPGNCPGNYTIARTWTVTPSCGDAKTCMQNITVQDTTAPMIGTPGADMTIDCPAIPMFTPPMATDNCDAAPRIVQVSDEKTPGSCAGAYTETVTWKAVDACGNESAPVSQTITVRDNTPPVIGTPGPDMTIDCPAIPAFTPPTATDSCDPSPRVVQVSDVKTPGNCAGAYTETVTWKAVDACGNESAPVSQSITVRDNTPPVIGAAGADKTIHCPETPVFTPPTATDGCDAHPTIVLVSDVTTPPDASGTYTETKTWKAVDACGNQSGTVSQTITVVPCALDLRCSGAAGQVGVFYSSALVASGGVPPYVFSIVSGSLPPGLMLNPDGTITGIPTEAGNFTYTAKVVDQNGLGVEKQVTCYITIIGIGGCRVTGGSNHQDNNSALPCVATYGIPSFVSHGGEVGASFSVGSPFTPNSPCISGEWEHNRHLKMNSLVGTFHAYGNGNVRQYDSLLCACLPCPENANAVGVVGGVCNPGDRICGPEPRKAPANKICFSGVGDYTFTTGNKTVKAVFRVDIEDRGEGNSQANPVPPDRYRIRIWLLDSTCRGGLVVMPDSVLGLALRYGASADPTQIGVLAKTEFLKDNATNPYIPGFVMPPPDIDDGGDMTQGDHQIHPATGAVCAPPAN